VRVSALARFCQTRRKTCTAVRKPGMCPNKTTTINLSVTWSAFGSGREDEGRHEAWKAFLVYVADDRTLCTRILTCSRLAALSLLSNTARPADLISVRMRSKSDRPIGRNGGERKTSPWCPVFCTLRQASQPIIQNQIPRTRHEYISPTLPDPPSRPQPRHLGTKHTNQHQVR